MPGLECVIDAGLNSRMDERAFAAGDAAARREHELIERARRGDVGAYEALVVEHERFSLRVAYMITRNAADAEDAVQEAFVKAYRALGRFRRGASFAPWLLKIVANEARTKRRSHRRHDAIAARAVEREPHELPARSAESLIVAEEHRRTLLAAVEALPEKQRLVVTCRYLLELSEEETAATLGLRRGTVKSRLSRALERLERTLRGAA